MSYFLTYFTYGLAVVNFDFLVWDRNPNIRSKSARNLLGTWHLFYHFVTFSKIQSKCSVPYKRSLTFLACFLKKNLGMTWFLENVWGRIMMTLFVEIKFQWRKTYIKYKLSRTKCWLFNFALNAIFSYNLLGLKYFIIRLQIEFDKSWIN